LSNGDIVVVIVSSGVMVVPGVMVVVIIVPSGVMVVPSVMTVVDVSTILLVFMACGKSVVVLGKEVVLKMEGFIID
jgi:hypothetical protein